MFYPRVSGVQSSGRLKIARDVAFSTSIIPSIDDEKKGIMKSTLKKGFNNLADSLQLCVDEE